MNKFGFARVTVCSPEVAVGNPAANVEAVEEALAAHKSSDVIVFPELSVTGYTCGDLFRQQHLLDAAIDSIEDILNLTVGRPQLVIVGAPIRVGPVLFNCAIVINGGRVLGIVPKQYIPTYNEFYEKRWFSAPTGNEPKTIRLGLCDVPFGTDLLFQAKDTPDLIVACEICEDLWMPIPPSSFAAIAGATLLVNLSASNETVAKNEYRMSLIKNQSGRCLAAYAYASAGPTESTTDLVFSGHCVIAENGNLLVETPYIGDGKVHLKPRTATADVDINRLAHERRVQTSFGDQKNLIGPYRTILWAENDDCLHPSPLIRYVPGLPFVPKDPATLANRCAAIFDIQCAGLAQRMKSTGMPILNIGVSGGLDSALALLVCHKTCQALGLPPTHIHAKTMPGFGTTSKTKDIAMLLMANLGVDVQVIDIRRACLQMFVDMGHKPFGIDIFGWDDLKVSKQICMEYFVEELAKIPKEKRHDLVFENVQARIRTQYLMNSGFTVGTGDLSELALGWCTYNGDHMSMYNVNCSVPKTLVRFLVDYVARNQYQSADQSGTRENLLNCVNLTISPELLPAGADGEIEQSTEDVLGPYILHDFYLWNFVRYGFSPEKILYLSEFADFGGVKFSRELREKTLHTFLRRFFSQQFKRDCVPGGPKVGSVSLSPRGDWRAPADANAEIWLTVK